MIVIDSAEDNIYHEKHNRDPGCHINLIYEVQAEDMHLVKIILLQCQENSKTGARFSANWLQLAEFT